MKKKTSSQTVQFAHRQISSRKVAFGAEMLEPRQLFSALPTVKLVADIPTASGITGADGQFEVTRTGSTSAPLKVYYVSNSTTTINSHEYTKTTGEVTIHGGESVSYIDVDPVVGLNLSPKKTYTSTTHNATVTVDENQGGTVVSGQRYYVPITIGANGQTRSDEPVDNEVDLTTALSGLGGSGAIEDSSIKVVETDSSGNTIDSNVPFQFDKDSDYDATSNASGDLILEMTGTTTSTQTRYYRVYFDTQGTYTTPTFTSQVSVSSENDAVGLDSYAVSNNTATYVMQKSTGGLSAIIDKDGNDWVGFNSAGGANGEYRGVPNLGTPDGLHPYDPSGNFPSSDAENTATTTIVNSGPLKTTINVTCDSGNVDVDYEFYANFVRVTVVTNNETSAGGAGKYWFLYEGTPGGSFNGNDTYLLSDSTTGTLGNSNGFDDANGIGNSTEGQWAAFQSVSENRFIYFANDTASSIEDSYYPLDGDMTVFGFGRTGPNSDPSQTAELSGTNSFTIGIADGNSTAASTIDGQYQAVSASVGTPALSS
jgi:hypothetical protein